MWGVAGDVVHEDTLQALWDGACAQFGRVDIWVNNAGIEGARAPFWEWTPPDIQAVIDVNLVAVLVACKIAIIGMRAQGGGHIYNMEGMGSDGRLIVGLTSYGTTKAALTYLTRALAAETAASSVKVSAINPGMVVTDLLLNSIAPERHEKAKRFFNIFADTVDTVAPWLVDQMLANKQSGKRIKWLTMPKMIGRFAQSRFKKRDLFADIEENKG